MYRSSAAFDCGLLSVTVKSPATGSFTMLAPSASRTLFQS